MSKNPKEAYCLELARVMTIQDVRDYERQYPYQPKLHFQCVHCGLPLTAGGALNISNDDRKTFRRFPLKHDVTSHTRSCPYYTPPKKEKVPC